MSPKPLLEADFCVIGAGSGGLSFTAGAAQLGARVILVERGPMGGDCLNTGCVPSKALIRAAHAGHHIKQASHFGWQSAPPTLDFSKVHDYIHSVIASIAPHDSVERFEKLGVRVLQEEGRFVDPRTLETENFLIRPTRFIIAAGSRPLIPDIDGLDAVPFITNETLFHLKELPKHLVILGGGPIGTEMAQAFLRLGSRVTLLQRGHMMPKDARELTHKLKEILLHEGLDLKERVDVTKVTKTPKGIEIFYRNQDDQDSAPPTLLASHLLIATGRKADLDSLHLERAQVDHTRKGIKVNASLLTSNPRIYALGDCIGGYQFTHAAGYHADLVIRRALFKLPIKMSTHAVPWVTYTDPELAHVGFQEDQLVVQKVAYEVLEGSFEDNDRAKTDNMTQGHMRVLVSPKGKILGVSILGPHAGELIYPWVMAINKDLGLSSFTSTIAPYPTLGAIHRQVAGRFYTKKLFSPRLRAFVSFLLRITR